MVTIFTPTYNRAYIIGKLYGSLLEQTDRNFEWLIVDDGSTDNTRELIGSFIREDRISIRYFRQENGGKHRGDKSRRTGSRWGVVFYCGQ